MPLLFPLAWAALGSVLGFAVNRLSLQLEKVELGGLAAELSEARERAGPDGVSAELSGLDLTLRASRWRDYFLPIASALLFGAFAYKFHPTLALLFVSLWTLVLLQIMVVDFEYRMILDWIVLPSAALAFVFSVFAPNAIGVKDWKVDLLCGILALIFFILLWSLPLLLFKIAAMGFGDVKLGLFIGLALGPAALNAIIYGILLGGLIPGILLVLRLKKRGDYIPYGPFLCLGALAALLLRS